MTPLQPKSIKKRVYVSSTYVDLKDFRAKVNERVRRAGFELVAMEDYPAFDERPVAKCLKDVASCDFYVGILANRYGYIPSEKNPHGLSITEMEYQKAGEVNITRLMFLLDPKKKIERYDDNNSPEDDQRIHKFRSEIEKRHGIRYFQDQEELGGIVLEAIINATNTISGDPHWRWPTAWDFTAYMESVRKNFQGRDWLFDEIQLWLKSEHPLALLICGDYGVGKSAFMAELVHRNPGGIVAAWHFCHHDTRRTLHAGTFVCSLASRLKEALPSYREKIEADEGLQKMLDKVLEDPATAFEAAILNPLALLPTPDYPRVIVIDGLDEGLEFEAKVEYGTSSIVSLLADKMMRFPNWLRLIATSRTTNAISLLRNSFGLKEIDIERQSNQEDIRTYILSRCKHKPIATKLSEHSKSPEDITALLQKKSEGKFLYAVRALNDIANGLMPVPKLGELTPGMDGFYLDAFRRRFSGGKSYESVREVLGLLATAKQPLMPSELSSILDITEDEVDERIHLVGDFVRYKSGAYALDHKSLTEWLTLKDENRSWRASSYHVDIRSAKEKFWNWALGQVEKRQTYRHLYLLRHLASHLDKNAIVRIFSDLLIDCNWLSAKIVAFGTDADEVIKNDVKMVQFISAFEAFGVKGDEDTDKHIKMVQEGELSVDVSIDMHGGPMHFRKISANGKIFGLPPPGFKILAFSHISSGQEKVVLVNTSPSYGCKGFVMVDYDISHASINYTKLCSSTRQQDLVRVRTDIVDSYQYNRVDSHQANFLEFVLGPMEVEILSSRI